MVVLSKAPLLSENCKWIPFARKAFFFLNPTCFIVFLYMVLRIHSFYEDNLSLLKKMFEELKLTYQSKMFIL